MKPGDEQQLGRDNFNDSDAEVASLLDSVMDEDDASLAAVSGDEGEEYGRFVDPTGRQQQGTNCAPMEYRQDRGAPAVHPPAYSTPALPISQPIRHDGLLFDMNQPWQRSLMKQYQNHQEQGSTTARRKRPDLMYVLHTSSRDHGISWDEGSAYSMDTTNNSILPSQPQFIHRVHHPIIYEPEPAVAGLSSLSETTKEGRDDSMSRPVGQGSHTPPPQFVDTPQEQSPKSVMGQHNQPRKHRMHDYMVPEAAAATMAPPDPACYCLGYNMLDVLLPPQGRRVKRPLSRVDEEILYQHQPGV